MDKISELFLIRAVTKGYVVAYVKKMADTKRKIVYYVFGKYAKEEDVIDEEK